jgi:hypothetical protein
VDLKSFEESIRIREFDPDGKVLDEDGASGGEQVTPDGVAYDPKTKSLYVLWREFTSSFLQSYPLHPERKAVERIDRRLVDDSPDVALKGRGMCIDPTGKHVAAWLTTMDEVVDYRTKNGMQLPATARLGRIGRSGKRGGRFIDVRSAIELHPWLRCDFSVASYTDTNGKEIGIRYGVGQYEAKAFFLDKRTVVINTPGGILLAVDIESGEPRSLNLIGQPISDLCFHREKRLLLMATKEGVLELCSP